MKTVDKYIAKNFLHSLLMCTLVMLAMRVLADLFVNMDEFAEVGAKLELGWMQLTGHVVRHVAAYYLPQCMIYFQELGGVVLVAAAMFSLVRMNHTNELIAVMAGGMSLYRVAAPIIIGGMLFAGIGVLDQELLIPAFKDALLLERDGAAGTKTIRVELVPDDKHNIWYSRRYIQESDQMLDPIIIPRDSNGRQQAKVTAVKAVEAQQQGGWILKASSMVVLSDSRKRGGLDSHLVRTFRSPNQLSASEENTDSDDGLGIGFDLAYENKLLVNPKFNVYAPKSMALKTPLMATLTASYGYYLSNGSDSGYLLLGSVDIKSSDIKDYSALCTKILSGEVLSSDNLYGRLWASMTADVREIIKQGSENKGAVPLDNYKKLSDALNMAVRSGVLLSGETAAADIKAARLNSEMLDTIAASGADAAEISAIIARALLDKQLRPDLVPSGGEMLLYSGLTGKEIVLRESGKWLAYMSAVELADLVRSGSAPNPMAVSLAMHLRFTTPVSWVLMLMLGLPFVVSRDRKLKSSALMCLMLVGGFYAFMFVSRYIGSDIYNFIDTGLQHYGLDGISRGWEPIFGAWIPIIVFVPVAVLMMDSIHSMHAYDLNDTAGELIFSPGGRIRRRVFWRYFPPVLAVIFLGMLIDLIWLSRLSLIFATAVIIGIWPLLALHFKRCHDRNRSGMFALMPLLPLIMTILIKVSVPSMLELKLAGWLAISFFASITLVLWAWVIAETWALPGDVGVNAFGDDPKGPAAT